MTNNNDEDDEDDDDDDDNDDDDDDDDKQRRNAEHTQAPRPRRPPTMSANRAPAITRQYPPVEPEKQKQNMKMKCARLLPYAAIIPFVLLR